MCAFLASRIRTFVGVWMLYLINLWLPSMCHKLFSPGTQYILRLHGFSWRVHIKTPWQSTCCIDSCTRCPTVYAKRAYRNRYTSTQRWSWSSLSVWVISNRRRPGTAWQWKNISSKYNNSKQHISKLRHYHRGITYSVCECPTHSGAQASFYIHWLLYSWTL